MKKIKKINIFSILTFILLFLYSLSLIVLLVWGILSSFKDPLLDFRTNYFGLPKEWKFTNYSYVYQHFLVPIGPNLDVTMFGQIINTLLICSLSSVCSAFFPCLIGYLVAKYKCKFSSLLYTMALVIMSLPIIGADPSMLALLKTLGLYDNYLTVFFHRSSYFGIYFFVYIAIFKSISNDFYEAASLDGAGDWRIFLRIMMPMIRNTFLTVFLLCFVNSWNDYQYALMYLPSMPTLSYGLYILSTSTLQEMNNVPIRMTGAAIVVLPILIVFIVFKERLMGNLSMGGLKE